MLPPEQYLEARQGAWDAMHLLFLDTDVEGLHLDYAATKCAETQYSVKELEQIFWSEVYPTMRWNILDPFGEWTPIDIENLTEAILHRHKFGQRIWFRRLRSHPSKYWNKLKSKIVLLRGLN